MYLLELLYIRNFLDFLNHIIYQNNLNITNLKTFYNLSIINKLTSEIINDHLKTITDIFEEDEKYIMFYDSITKTNIPLKRINNMLLYNINSNSYKNLKWNELFTNSYFITDKKEIYSFITSMFDYRHFILDEQLIQQLFLEVMNKDIINDDYIEFIYNKDSLIEIFLKQIQTTKLYLPFAIQNIDPLKENPEKYQLIANIDYEIYFRNNLSDDELYNLYNSITRNVKQKITDYIYSKQLLNYFDYFTIKHVCYKYYSDFESVISISVGFNFTYFKELLYIQYCKDIINNI